MGRRGEGTHERSIIAHCIKELAIFTSRKTKFPSTVQKFRNKEHKNVLTVRGNLVFGGIKMAKFAETAGNIESVGTFASLPSPHPPTPRSNEDRKSEAGGLWWPPIFARAKQFRPVIHTLRKKTRKRTVLEAGCQKRLGQRRRKP